MATQTAANSPYTFDDSVENRLTGMLQSDSPLMKRAEQQGYQTANKRGLLNSSMAAGAAQGAMIDRATPIATAEAQFANNKNLQTTDIAAQMDRLTTQAGFTKELTVMDNVAQMERVQFSANEEMKRLQASMANANEQQRVAIKAQMDQLVYSTNAQIHALNVQASHASNLQAQGSTQQMERMRLESANTLKQIQAQGDQEMRRTSATLDASMKELQLTVSSGDRNAAMNAAAALHQSSQQLQQSIISNPEIPAAQRNQWLTYAQQQAAIGVNLINQVQGVGINYGSSAPGGGQ